MDRPTFDTQFDASLPRNPPPRRISKSQIQKYEALIRTRLSKNFVLRDFMFSAEAALLGLANMPEDPEAVIRAGKAVCERVLEPLQDRFGRAAITFGYQCREAIERHMSVATRAADPPSSCPHEWDRKSWGQDAYARVDILPFCVVDGDISRHEYGRWMMMNLDIDLLMMWTRSDVYCITISPRPRRVWLEWGDAGRGEPRKTVYMGASYWQKIYPELPVHERPKFGPSCTGGSITWSRTIRQPRHATLG